MRNIKFRAWDKTRSEYLSGGNLYIEIAPGKCPLNSFVYLDLIKDPDRYRDRFVIEQYTGIKDKNGTEIYEGDILHEEGYWDIRIEFEIGSFTCRSLDKVQYVNRIVDVPIGKFDLLSKFEVIGNIHENPELLEGRE